MTKCGATIKRKYIWIIAAAVLICLFLCIAGPILFQLPSIGRVYGPENEYLEIDGVVYERTASHPYTSLDRGRYLGSVRNEKITMRVFEVNGVEDREYLHVLWDWEGYFYVRQSG